MAENVLDGAVAMAEKLEITDAEVAVWLASAEFAAEYEAWLAEREAELVEQSECK